MRDQFQQISVVTQSSLRNDPMNPRFTTDFTRRMPRAGDLGFELVARRVIQGSHHALNGVSGKSRLHRFVQDLASLRQLRLQLFRETSFRFGDLQEFIGPRLRERDALASVESGHFVLRGLNSAQELPNFVD
jgi:hypothetical protein